MTERVHGDSQESEHWAESGRADSALRQGVRLPLWRPIHDYPTVVSDPDSAQSAIETLRFLFRALEQTPGNNHRELLLRLGRSGRLELEAIDNYLRGAAQAEKAEAETGGLYVDEISSLHMMRLWKAVQDVSHSLGLTRPQITTVRDGSVFTSFKTWLRDLVTSESSKKLAAEVVAEGRAYVEGLTLGRLQAEIDSTNSSSVATLMAEIKDVDNAAVHVGSVLILKYRLGGESNLLIETLNPRQQVLLSRHPELKTNPKTLMSDLADLSRLEGPDSDTGLAIRPGPLA